MIGTLSLLTIASHLKKLSAKPFWLLKRPAGHRRDGGSGGAGLNQLGMIHIALMGNQPHRRGKMEAAKAPNRLIKIGATICFWGVLLWGTIIAINWLIEHDRERERGWKRDCIARGGKVIEHIGGFNRFDCDGPTSFR